MNILILSHQLGNLDLLLLQQTLQIDQTWGKQILARTTVCFQSLLSHDLYMWRSSHITKFYSSDLLLLLLHLVQFCSATTTVIHRPHGDSMLVIRPSVNKHKQRPLPPLTNHHTTKKPAVTQTSSTTNLPNFTNTATDLDTAASISTGLFSKCSIVLSFCITWRCDCILHSNKNQMKKEGKREKRI